jgi:hypothetical protein
MPVVISFDAGGAGWLVSHLIPWLTTEGAVLGSRTPPHTRSSSKLSWKVLKPAAASLARYGSSFQQISCVAPGPVLHAVKVTVAWLVSPPTEAS